MSVCPAIFQALRLVTDQSGYIPRALIGQKPLTLTLQTSTEARLVPGFMVEVYTKWYRGWNNVHSSLIVPSPDCAVAPASRLLTKMP